MRIKPFGMMLGIAVVIFLVIAGVFIVWWDDPAERVVDDGDRSRQRAEAQELARLKNLGLARLENSEALAGGADAARGAEEAFAKIAERRPGLVLGVRNLAVARLVLLAGGADPDRLPTPGQPPSEQIGTEDLQEARDAVAALERLEPEAATTAVIMARLATLAGEFESARKTLDAAINSHPDAAWLAYERYRLDRFAADENVRESARDALGKAYAAAPGNLWITREWLGVLAERESEQLIPVLHQARDLLEPLASGIARRTRVDLPKVIDEAFAAVESGDWAAAARGVRTLINVTVQEEQAQSDKLAVDRNALEFVAIDFPNRFYESTEIQRRPEPKAIPVSFVEKGPVLATPDAEGIAVADFDLDGREEIAVAGGQSVRLFPSPAEGSTPIAEYTDDSLAADGFTNVIAADLDSDVDRAIEAKAAENGEHCQSADPDLVFYGDAGLLVLRNDKTEDSQRTLVSVAQSEALQGMKNVRTAEFADFDLDGDLDLVVSTDGGMSFWANVGNLRFEDRTDRVDAPPENWLPRRIVPVDLDRDVDLDLVLAGAGGSAGYLENLRHGNLRWRAFDPELTAFDIALIESNGDASWDLIAATDEGLKLVTSQTPRPGRWTIKDIRVLNEGSYRSLREFDYDNDGLGDVLARTGDSGSALFRNRGGAFEKQDVPPILDGGILEAVVFNRDEDGDYDLLVLTAQNEVHCLDNDGGNANHWVDVSLVAQQVKGGQSSASGRVNHAGLGSLVELKSGPAYQAAVVRDGTTRFGLGATETADVIRVLWTNGIPQSTIEPTPEMVVCEKQSLKGSCPYLYTYDGERFVFSTDLLWNSPIGLQFAEGVVAPTRPWEYLRIPTPIRPDDEGYYTLQLTEELWEAAYFDLVELIAIDHPVDVEVYTNEKVGPASIASPRLHTVIDPRAPVAARDGYGRDILKRIARRDDRYVKAFDRKYLQGLCERHAIELDFGDLGGAERVTLFLAGWIYPTDTSINVRKGQREDLPPSEPPSLSVPNREGEWVEVMPNMGFPGGKTKTIVIDMTDQFLCEDRRVRIETTMEIYWDAAFITVDEPVVATIRRRCPLASADLHERGVSAAIGHPGHGPERYDYSRVRERPVWPPMRGRFTRYGDVRGLLSSTDDRQVVMAAGDEVTLRFTVPESAPPTGWTRTFVLHNVGYDKDADMNTIYGQSSEPLPFRAMSQYPYAGTQRFPDSMAHKRYLREYQTRELPGRAFWTELSAGRK